MVEYYFTNFSSPFSTFTIIWDEHGPELKVKRIFLSDPKIKSEEKAFEEFKTIKLGSSSIINSLGNKIVHFLEGEKIEFELQIVDFNQCFKVQKEVLLAEYGIPRGWISTYKRIANKIGIQNGARVVGNALARNPFPIVIPCHRAIKTNGELGGFQGGIEMKRALLEMEGIRFSNKGKVITNRIYY
ncbi:MAG: MGMT family protein [Candidatus Lokiarchaeota archaeon]|nr:MGMT family protein [Candidatus Lokiarchaeota archaeon]